MHAGLTPQPNVTSAFTNSTNQPEIGLRDFSPGTSHSERFSWFPNLGTTRTTMGEGGEVELGPDGDRQKLDRVTSGSSETGPQTLWGVDRLHKGSPGPLTTGSPSLRVSAGAASDPRGPSAARFS